MNLNRKKAPGRWSRAIVALVAMTGKKLTWTRKNDQPRHAPRGNEINCIPENVESYPALSERTTITIETERLLIVRRASASEAVGMWRA